MGSAIIVIRLILPLYQKKKLYSSENLGHCAPVYIYMHTSNISNLKNVLDIYTLTDEKSKSAGDAHAVDVLLLLKVMQFRKFL